MNFFKIHKHSIINILIYLSIYIFLHTGETIGPHKVGFWCNDESIRHEYKPQFIDFKLLLAIVFVFPLLCFTLDLNDIKYHSRNYYYGLGTNLVLTMYCKLIIARPRPNFFSLCQPEWKSVVECGLADKKFITDYICKNQIKWLASNSNQSFYSGHSSLGTYTAMFLIFYSNDKLKIHGLLKTHLFFSIFMIGLLPGLTQYLNFWHFASDVIFGDLTGISLAIFVYYGTRYFDNSSRSTQQTVKTN